MTSHSKVSSFSRTDRLLKKFMDMSGEIKKSNPSLYAFNP